MTAPEAGIFVHQFVVGPWDNFVYLIGDRKTRSCAVVDPAWDVDRIRAEAEQLDVTIDHMLCTHAHFDHVNRVSALLETHDIPVHMLAAEVDQAGFQSENLVRHRAGDVLEIGALEIRMVHTPGHTPGSCSYAIPGGLVAGDTLFVNGCGRCDFVGGDPAVMYGTLKTLTSALAPETVLYPGHDYGATPTSTMTAELRDNPFLQKPTLADFVAHRMEGKTPGTELPPEPEWPAPDPQT